MKTAYIGLGSNLKRPKNNLQKALQLLQVQEGISILDVAPIYKTVPVGGPKQPAYLNSVVKLGVRVSPIKLWESLMHVEKKMGRVRKEKWGPRIIDLDLLVYGRQKIKKKFLTVPHPRYHERRFVLVPFCKIAPKVVHPNFQLANKTLLRRLTPHVQRVTIYSEWSKLPSYRSKKSTNKKSR